MKTLKLSAVILLSLLINISAQDVVKEKSSITYNTGSSFIKLQACTDKVIRVMVSPTEEMEKESLVVIDNPGESTSYTVTEDDRYISFKTSQVTARIDKENRTVSFFDVNNNLILKGDKFSFKRDSNKYEHFYNVEQRFKLSPVEAIYGLGQYQEGVMNFRNHDVTLFQENIQIAVPVFISTKNYAILWDNYSLTKFHDGKEYTSMWSKVADNIDYYFIAGDNFDDVISGYRTITGKAPMFAKWAYGYWQSKERYNNQEEITDAVTEYRKRELPLDLIVQDWMYWGDLGWSALDFDRKKFPDPKGMIETIHGMNSHIMISIWPNFATTSEVYRDMKSKGFLITSDNDESRGLYDAYNPKARELYWDWLNKNMFSIGMDAWWMDATEPEVKGETLEERIKIFEDLGKNHLGSMARYMLPFSLMSTKGVYENQRATTDKKRVCILTRSAFAGQQRYGAVSWSGDIHAQWYVLRNQISAGLNFCATGLPYWTTDIGAFLPDNPLGNKDNAYREIYVRWYQYGAFNPIFRSHGSGTSREIWHFGEQGSWGYETLKKFDNLRYRLLPYIYSTAWQVTNNDYTMMRALAFDFANDANVYNIDNQFMFGPAFLVRPITEKMYFEKNYLGDLLQNNDLFDKSGKQGGLTTEYFNGIDFDTLVTSDIKTKIDFDWNDGVSRPEGVHQHYYSIRFSGEIEAPESGSFTFLTTSNDGIRLKINGEKVLENWTPHGATVDVGKIELEKGKRYKIELEYFQTLGGAITKLTWIKPSVAAELKQQEMKATKYAQVYLPEGNDWFDFWRGTKHNGGQTVSVAAPIDEIPLFVKAGSIVPMGSYLQYSTEKPADPIVLRIYIGTDAEFVIYEDENDNYNYEKGAFATIPLKWNEKEQTLTIGQTEGEFPGMLKKRVFKIVWVGENHGTGMESVEDVDKTVKYRGKKIVVTRN